MIHRRAQRRTPQVGELWAERAPKRATRPVRCVRIISTTDTHAHVENVRTRRKSSIMLSEFTSGILTGWYRRYAPQQVPFPPSANESREVSDESR